MSGIIGSILSMGKAEPDNIAVKPEDDSEKAFLESMVKSGENFLKYLEEKGEKEYYEELKGPLELAKRVLEEIDNG